MSDTINGKGGQSGGPAVDRGGDPVVDPTKNVLDLVQAAIKRIDDLRIANRDLYSAKLAAISEVSEVRLNAIEREFALIESRRVEQKVDTKTAVDAALSAAKDAVKEQAAASEKAILKSETAAGEQSKQNAVTFSAQMQNVTSMLSDVKERVSKLESLKTGGEDYRTNQRLGTGMVLGIVGAVIAVLTLFIALSNFVKLH